MDKIEFIFGDIHYKNMEDIITSSKSCLIPIIMTDYSRSIVNISE